MKKTAVITTGVAVILAGSWLGGTWYTGKRIESDMPGFLDQYNAQLEKAMPGYGVKLTRLAHERGFFTSHARFGLTIEGVPGSEERPLLPAGLVEFDTTIEHGPFPKGALARGHWLPKAAFAHAEIARTPGLEDLYELTGGRSILTSDTVLAYNGDSSGSAEMPPMDIQKDGEGKLNFSGATLRADYTRATGAVKGSLQAKSLSLEAVGDDESGPLSLAMDGLDATFDVRQSKHDIALGNGQFKIQRLAASDTEDGFDIRLSDLVFDQKADEDNEAIHGEAGYQIGNLTINGQDWGSGRMVAKVANLDGAATKRLLDAYQHILDSEVASQNAGDGDTAAQQAKEAAIDALLPNVLALLAGKPTISLDPLVWKTAKGESTVTYSLTLAQPANATESIRDLVQQAITSLNARASISKPMAQELVANYLVSQGQAAEEAATEAESQVSMVAGLVEMLKVARNDGDNVVSELSYADGKAMLNGREIPPEQIFGNLPDSSVAELLADSAEADPATSPAPEGVSATINADDVLSALNEAGYNGRIGRDDVGDPIIHVEPADTGADKIEVQFYDCNDSDCDSILLSARLPAAAKATDALLNTWNKENRWTRAYRDDDEALVLEMDVSATGGIASANVSNAIGKFLESTGEFAEAMRGE